MSALTVDVGLVQAVRRERAAQNERVRVAADAIAASLATSQGQPLLLDLVEAVAAETRLDLPTVKLAFWGLVEAEAVAVSLRGRVSVAAG